MSVSWREPKKVRRKRVVIATATVILAAGQRKKLTIVLNRTGKSLLAKYRHLSAADASDLLGKVVSTRAVKLSKPPKRPGKKHR